MILDIHTHADGAVPNAVVNQRRIDFTPIEGQFYSVGIHPWDITENPIESMSQLRQVASAPYIVAIGECGIDVLRGGMMFRQLQCFKAQILLSEQIAKPLIIHNVKAHDMIISLHKEIAPRQPWIIHGFRGKPTVASMLLDRGCYLSFGEHFNSESLLITPKERILAETDESSLSIDEIIFHLSTERQEDISTYISTNVRRVLGIG